MMSRIAGPTYSLACAARWIVASLLVASCDTPSLAEVPLRVGFAHQDITPAIAPGKPVWLAGYGWGRSATDIHDPLYARAVVLAADDAKIALVSVDLIGLQFPEVERIRARLSDFEYVMVSSTHNHEGPDTIGIWGKTPLQRGVDPEYLDHVVQRVVIAVQAAEAAAKPRVARFGTAQDDRLLGDSRKPVVKDGILRVLTFHEVADDPSLARSNDAETNGTQDGRSPTGILLQWNCHPEALGPRNTRLTADFCYQTIRELQDRFECPVAYFSGAVGGLMAPPDHMFHDQQGRELREGQFEFAEAYGSAVAELAVRAIDNGRPIQLTPFAVQQRPIAIPIRNPLYRTARIVGVLRRKAVQWTGDPDVADQRAIPAANQTYAVRSEVGCLKLGQLYAICVPGEIYPELVYGKYQEPADPAVDFPDAPLETPLVAMIPEGQRWMLFGLANDEIGYIIPKRQWDRDPPYAYGRQKSQYGEINSCGVDVAPIVMQVIEQQLSQLSRQP